MNQEKLIYSLTASPCHHGCRNIVVRSREGGFVTQNCEECGEPRSISPEEFPKAKCHECKVDMVVAIINKNYAYQCTACGKVQMIYSLVPSWAERFDYHGYGIPGVDFEYWY